MVSKEPKEKTPRVDQAELLGNQYTWQVVARFKLRPWNKADGIWYYGSANYFLAPK
jgi:hypothetical protein